MRSRIAWIVTGAWICSAQVSLGIVNAAPVPALKSPIVLHYGESPIFLGPHEHSVTAIAFSPDGKTLATGSNDGRLRIWDCATGRLKSLHGDDATRGIHGLAFSSDGRRVAVVGALFGDDVVIWDIAAGRIAQKFKQEIGPAETTAAADRGNAMIYKGKPIVFRALNAVAFSADAALLATAGDEVVLRQAPSGSIRAKLANPGKGVKGLVFTADGKILATAGQDRKVRLWSLPAGKLEQTLEGSTQPISGLALSPDGKRVVAAGSDNRSLLNRTPVGRLWAWDRPNNSVRRIEVGTGQVTQVAFVTRTTVVVAAGRDLLTVDLQDGGTARTRKIGSYSDQVLAVAVSPDRRLVASGGVDRSVEIVDLSTGKLIHRLPGLMDIVSSVATSRDGQKFATATMDVRFSNRRPVEETSFDARYKKFFSDGGRLGGGRLGSGPQPGEVRVWSMRDGRLQATLPLPPSQVTAIDFIPGTDQLAVAGWEPEKGGMLSVWDLNSGTKQRDFGAQPAEVLAIAVSVDGRILASGDAEGNAHLWETASGRKMRSHKHNYPVKAVAFSADGKLLATGDANRTALVIDVSSGAIVRNMSSRSKIESLAFSPDSTLLAAGTRDPGVEVWDMSARTASRTLKAPGDYFEAMMPGFVAFSPDGRFIVCGGHGKDIAVFHAATSTLHGELRGHFHAPTTAKFLPDGRLISGAEERTTRLWDVDHRVCLSVWITMPADRAQNWDEEWVGFTPAGQFVGSARLDRLLGWQTGGDILIGPNANDRRRRVEGLFRDEASVPSTPN